MFIQTETTPNPATLKFIPGEPVMGVGGAANFTSKADAARSPLAEILFKINGVEAVYLGSDFVSVTKESGQDWGTLKVEILTTIMEHYVAGLQKYLKPFLVMVAPTINSYTRLVKGAWAPTSAAWGVENRTTALRVIPGSAKSQRVEFRLSAADTNPYLVAAANIASGLLGIQQKLTLGDDIKGNAYEQQDNLPQDFQLATNLRDAARCFKESKEAMEVFGSTFVEHFSISREWEAREYERSINDWQLKRYFEII